MTVTVLKDPYCDQIKIKKAIKEFCAANDLYFHDSDTYYFGFSIVKRIPYTNTGFLFRLINGKYISKYICDGSITDHGIVSLHFQPVDFQPNGTDKIMKTIVHYLDDSDTKAEITYPCEYNPGESIW